MILGLSIIRLILEKRLFSVTQKIVNFLEMFIQNYKKKFLLNESRIQINFDRENNPSS